MNTKLLVIGLMSVVTVVGAGAVAAIILINNETPAVVNTASTANIQEMYIYCYMKELTMLIR